MYIKTMGCLGGLVHGNSKQPMVLLYMVLEGLAHEPCARPPKQSMVLEGLAHGFKTMCT